jgi:hypothetical protein
MHDEMRILVTLCGLFDEIQKELGNPHLRDVTKTSHHF